MSDVECARCAGPCRVPEWARDGAWYANNPDKFAGAVARAHQRLEPGYLAEGARVRAALREMRLAPTYPCTGCRQFAFGTADVLCFWCRRGRA